MVAFLALVMLVLPGCGRSTDPEKVITESLRDITGVRKASTMPWLIRAPDYLFLVDLDDDPTADTLAEVIRVYGASWEDTPPVARFDAAFGAAPTVSELRVSQTDHDIMIDTVAAEWEQPSDAVRPEMEALVDVWAASPTPLALTLRVGPDAQAALDNRTCPDPESNKLPLTQELWEYAQRPGHRIVLAPEC